MRIGLDLDGVFADFNRAYITLLQHLTGRHDFLPQDVYDPPCWDYDVLRGYTKNEIRMAWEHIAHSPNFWRDLWPLDGVKALDPLIPAIEDFHDIYYITSRPGRTAKHQSEQWIRQRLGYTNYSPTVLVTSDKANTAKGLKLRVYVDDKLENVVDVAHAVPKCRVYLLDYSYNQGELPKNVTRVATVQDVIDRELPNL